MASRRFDPELLLIGKLLRLLSGHAAVHSQGAAYRVARYVADRQGNPVETPPAYFGPPLRLEEPTAEPTPLPLFPADVAGTVSSPDLLRGITVIGDSGAISSGSSANTSSWKDGVPF